jgi:hypothetical protein
MRREVLFFSFKNVYLTNVQKVWEVIDVFWEVIKDFGLVSLFLPYAI